MVAQDGGLVVAQGVGDALALLEVEHDAGVVVEERRGPRRTAGVLGDRVEEAPERGPGPAVLAVGVGGGLDVGAGLVHLGVDGEGGTVDGPVALDHLTVVVDPDEVRGPDEAEGQAERVHPERVGELGVAGGEVAGHALVEAEPVEEPEGRGHPLLDVGPLRLHRVEGRQLVRAGRSDHGKASCARAPLRVRPAYVSWSTATASAADSRPDQSRFVRYPTRSSRLIVRSSSHQSPAWWTRPTMP